MGNTLLKGSAHKAKRHLHKHFMTTDKPTAQAYANYVMQSLW